MITGQAASRIQIRPVTDPSRWEACRLSLPGACIFHRWDWLRLTAHAEDSNCLHLGLYAGEALRGLVPLLVKTWGPYKKADATFVPYLGPLVPADLFSDSLVALDTYQRRNHLSAVNLKFGPAAYVDDAALRREGYDVAQEVVPILSLVGRSESDLRAAMTASRRRNLQRAQREGVTLATATQREITDDLPAIMAEVFARRNLSSTPFARITRPLWQDYHNNPDVRMVTAHHGGHVAAILITLRDRDRAFIWLGAGWDAFRQINANALLYYDAILWAHAQGCSHLDLGTSDQGIARFKAGFGHVKMAAEVTAFRINSHLMRWARDVRLTGLSPFLLKAQSLTGRRVTRYRR